MSDNAPRPDGEPKRVPPPTPSPEPRAVPTTPQPLRAMPTSVPSGIPRVTAAPAGSIAPTARAGNSPVPVATPSAASSSSGPAKAKAPESKPPEPSLQLRTRTRLEQWEQILTSTPALYTGGLLAAFVFLWTVFVVLPRGSESQVVVARERLSELGQRLLDASALAAVDQVVLSNQVVTAERFLIQRREDFVVLVGDVERAARQCGWKPELTVKPANERLSPVDLVNVFPVTLRLIPPSAPVPGVLAYQRLISFLDRVEQIPSKVEVVSLAAQGERGALAAVQLELHFWVKKPNEKPAAK